MFHCFYFRMDQLEHLSLVSKVLGELENHFGVADKDVAEFVIQMAQENPTFDKFKKELEVQGLSDQVRIVSNLNCKKFFTSYFRSRKILSSLSTYSIRKIRFSDIILSRNGNFSF